MSDPELFPPESVAMDSPRLLWMKRLGLDVHRAPDEVIGIEDDFGDIITKWYIVDTKFHPGEPMPYEGETQDEALQSYAVKHGIPLWNETP